MKIVATPIELKKVIGDENYKYPRQIIDHLFEEITAHPAFSHVYSDSNITVVLEPKDIELGKEVLTWKLNNALSRFDNSYERRQYYPTEYANKTFVLTVDKKAVGTKNTIARGTVLYCVGKVFRKNHQDFFFLTNGTDTVFCMKNEIKKTLFKKKVDGISDERTAQFVFTNIDLQSIKDNAPICKGTEIYCIGCTFINGTKYYVLANDLESAFCRAEQFYTAEDISKMKLSSI